MPRSREEGVGRARRYLAPASALAGAGLLGWLLVSIGPARLIELWTAIRPILPLLVMLTGLRYVLQAAGWRLATRVSERPGWGPVLAGVIAGEAAGYMAGGMVAREPVKLLFVRDRVPPRVALSGAAIERLALVSAGAVLIVTAWTIIAATGAPRLLAGILGVAALATSIAVGWTRLRVRSRAAHEPAVARRGPFRRALASTREMAVDLWRNRRSTLVAISALALAQEAVNIAEAYIVLTWIGAAPGLVTVIAFEGASRTVNTVAQFVPGRMGVSEAISALVAGIVHLNPIYGLSLALARRARSILWAIVGLALLVLRSLIATMTPAAGSPSSSRLPHEVANPTARPPVSVS